MTNNAIQAMRLQEEKRHNQAVEEEAAKSRKSGFIADLVGSAVKGLGTGVLTKVMSAPSRAKTLSEIVATSSRSKGGRR